MLEYTLFFSGYDLKHKKRLNVPLDFMPVQIITGHVIYNSHYKYWPAERGHTQILVKDWLFRLGSHESEYSNMASKTVMIFLGWLVKSWIFFAIYSQLEHSFHTWPSDASRIESDLMSRWMTPCECRYAIAFRHCLQTVAICSSSSLQRKKCESFFILNAHRPT